MDWPTFCAWSGFPDVYSAPGASFCFLVSERQNKFMESSSYLFCPFCHPLISFLLSQRRQLIDQVAFSPWRIRLSSPILQTIYTINPLRSVRTRFFEDTQNNSRLQATLNIIKKRILLDKIYELYIKVKNRIVSSNAFSWPSAPSENRGRINYL